MIGTCQIRKRFRRKRKDCGLWQSLSWRFPTENLKRTQMKGVKKDKSPREKCQNIAIIGNNRPVSLFIVGSIWLSWFEILKCQKYQHFHKSSQVVVLDAFHFQIRLFKRWKFISPEKAIQAAIITGLSCISYSKYKNVSQISELKWLKREK